MEPATSIMVRTTAFVVVLPMLWGVGTAAALRGRGRLGGFLWAVLGATATLGFFSGVDGGLGLPPREAIHYVPIAMLVSAGVAWVGTSDAKAASLTALALGGASLIGFWPLTASWGIAQALGAAAVVAALGTIVHGGLFHRTQTSPSSLAGLFWAAAAGGAVSMLSGSARLAQQQGALAMFLAALIGASIVLQLKANPQHANRWPIAGLRAALLTAVFGTIAISWAYADASLAASLCLVACAAVPSSFVNDHVKSRPAPTSLSTHALQLASPIAFAAAAVAFAYAGYEPNPYGAYS